jgi:hypothetical protein
MSPVLDPRGWPANPGLPAGCAASDDPIRRQSRSRPAGLPLNPHRPDVMAEISDRCRSSSGPVWVDRGRAASRPGCPKVVRVGGVRAPDGSGQFPLQDCPPWSLPGSCARQWRAAIGGAGLLPGRQLRAVIAFPGLARSAQARGTPHRRRRSPPVRVRPWNAGGRRCGPLRPASLPVGLEGALWVVEAHDVVLGDQRRGQVGVLLGRASAEDGHQAIECRAADLV